MDNNIKNNIEAIQDGVIKKGNFNFKDVHVFTMPKGIKRSSGQKNNEADSAKKTGFIILIFGSLFLIFLLAASYYFFVMKPGQAQDIKTNQTSSQDGVDDKKTEIEEVVSKKSNEMKETNNEVKEVLIEKEVQSPGDNKNIENIEKGENQQEQADNEGVIENIVEEEQVAIVIIDNDNDGLSAKEEVAVGTSDFSPDTDSDSYQDLAEMLNGYNPTGEGLISANVNFKKFTNSKYNFSFYYPKVFATTAKTNDAIIFDLGGEEFFQLFIEANEGKLDIEDWYKKQFGINVMDSGLISVNGDWNVIKNEDLKSVFFKNNRDDYVIAFNYSIKNESNYQNIFEIVFSTFEVLN